MDFDVLLEAKRKDQALMKLREDLGLDERDPGDDWMEQFAPVS